MRKLLLSLSLASLSTSCIVDDSSGDPIEPNIDPKSVIAENLSRTVIIPAYKDAAEKAQTLSTDINGYCSGISSPNSASLLSQAQESWLNAARAWQFTEAFLIGPALNTVSGAILKHQVINNYSATSKVNPSIIDGNMYFYQLNTGSLLDINSTGASPEFLGLNALEYLLFMNTPETLDSGVSDTSTINTWNALGNDSARIEARCQFASKIGTRLANDTQSLVTAWESYQTTFNSDNEAAVNELSNASFYFDTVVKDVKLAQTLGLLNKCSSSCEENAESRYAQKSYQLIKANLEGFRAIFTGNNTKSFQAIYDSRDQSQAAIDFIANIDTALSSVDTLIQDSTSLYTFATTADAQCGNDFANPSNGQNACNLAGQVKLISDHLKDDFTIILDTDIPSSAQGDGD